MKPLPKDAILSLVWPVSDPVPFVPAPPKPERAPTPDGCENLESALDAIPNNDVSYDEWFKVACAVHYATEGAGIDLFRAWSAQSAKHDDTFLEERVWPYLGVTSGEVITERTLFALAAQHGWQDPTIADDFEEIPHDAADEFDVLGSVGTGEGEQRGVQQEGADALPSTDGGPPLRFAPIPAHEFAVATQLRWIIKGILPHSELAVLYGASGSGKSFMALDMAAAIARGIQWRGHKVHQGKVVYIAAEGANGFRNRLRAYAFQHQLDLKDLPIHVIHAAPNMLEKTDALDVAKAIVHVVGKPDLIIIDTLAQTMPGGDENGGEDMGRAMAHCRGLHRATGGLVMLVHHSGKDASKGARGWSGLRAAADVELEVIRSDDDRVLTVTKQKDGDDGAEFGFKLETVLVDFDADGDEVTSCVVEHCQASRSTKMVLKGANQKLVMRTFEDLIGVGGEEVEREELIRAVAVGMDFDPASGKKDRRREMAVKAIESILEARLLSVNGTRLLRGNA